ncbi:AraC family transcriptional regulator [Bradyrhizobium sp. CIR3A]|uniref:AraC family transcriptional regulator n=1 Tax=Bradyrhizobium sp. CIR3A TaxID=2663838 RepID=UPI0016067A9A|nr:AraC family transcriptional regulator [Bradyrhizobium sp. CIR3A]MBB4261346.1 AraC-like DNA-binding protein [Bradyrhizobium sp. CIR3A]
MDRSRSAVSVNQSKSWSDQSLAATEFFFADYRDFMFPPHVHETFAIGVIQFGGQRFRAGRATSLVMPEGSLCAINPGVVHEGGPATARGWQYRMIYPSPALVAATLRESHSAISGDDWRLAGHVIDDPELFRDFVRLHVSSQEGEAPLERQTRFAIFLRRLFERHGHFAPRTFRMDTPPRTATIVREYLHANAHDQVSIDDLAQAANVSNTQVIRAFSAATGMPPHAYLVSLRVERAKVLLRAGHRLAETALQVGFADQSQFTRHFKRLTGATPGRFAVEVSPRKVRNRQDGI